MIRLALSCFPAILSPISMHMSNKEAIYLIRNFEVQTQNMKKYTFFSYLGGGGVLRALTSNPSERKFQGSKTSPQSRHMYNKGKNNYQFFIYGPQYKKIAFLAIRVGPGWPKNNRTGPILLPIYPISIYI